MQEADTFLGEGTERFLSLVHLTQISPREQRDKHGLHWEPQKKILVCMKDVKLSWLSKEDFQQEESMEQIFWKNVQNPLGCGK